MTHRDKRPTGPYFRTVITFTGTKEVESCICRYIDYRTEDDSSGKTGALAAARKFIADWLESPRLKGWKIFNSAGYPVYRGE
jgi:hypothetical protein